MAIGSSLEYINDFTIGASDSTLECTDVFTSSYDNYVVKLKGGNSTVGYIRMRFLDSGGSPITTSNYYYRYNALIHNASYGTTGSSSPYTSFERISYNYQNKYAGDGIYNIYKPFDSSCYTFIEWENTFESVGVMYGMKGGGMYKVNDSVTGIQIHNSSSATMADLNVAIYGVAS